MEKLTLKYPVIVEGRYDKIKLSSIIEGAVIATEGFGIFKNTEKLALLKRLAEKSPVIVLTDSDGGGKVIRSHITSAIPKDKLIQLYVPQIKGREKRKAQDSAEGYLGVEGMDADFLRELLLPFSDQGEESGGVRERAEITKLDFYNDGLSGGAQSAQKRDMLAQSLGLPRNMSANSLLEAIRILCTYEEYKSAVSVLD